MKRLPITPRSRIVSLLRRLSLWSRERAQVIKIKKCFMCGKEGKVEAHHTIQPNWEAIIFLIRKELLSNFVAVCHSCHEAITKKQREK